MNLAVEKYDDLNDLYNSSYHTRPHPIRISVKYAKPVNRCSLCALDG